MAGMFDFMGDMFGGATGQRDVPGLKSVSPGDLIGSMQGSVGPLADLNAAWNKRRGIDSANLANNIEDIYDPNQRNLRSAGSKAILDELNLGGNLAPDVQDNVIRTALQGNVASGFGVSPGGRGLVARDLGLTSMDVKNQRMDRASRYSLATPKGFDMYKNQDVGNPNDIADLVLGNNNAENAYNTFASRVGSQNNQNMFGSLLKGAGSIFGGLGGGEGGGGIINMLSGRPDSVKGEGGGGGGGGGGSEASGILSGLGGLGLGAVGGMYGGPIGAAVGSGVGKYAGSMFGNLFA